jgi:hypothetical protein
MLNRIDPNMESLLEYYTEQITLMGKVIGKMNDISFQLYGFWARVIKEYLKNEKLSGM